MKADLSELPVGYVFQQDGKPYVKVSKMQVFSFIDCKLLTLHHPENFIIELVNVKFLFEKATFPVLEQFLTVTS